MRIFGVATKRLAERLLLGRVLVAECAGQLADDRVHQHHRCGLTARQHVPPDRHGIRGELLHDSLIKAFVAPAEQRDALGLGGEFVDETLVKHPAAGGQSNDTAILAQLQRILAVDRLQCLIHDIDAQDHPCPTTERGIINLTTAQRRGVPRIEGPDLMAELDGVLDVPLGPEPVEPLRLSLIHISEPTRPY